MKIIEFISNRLLGFLTSALLNDNASFISIFAN